MCTRARCFFARLNRLQLSAPLVQTSPGHPELLGQFIDAHTGPHALYGHALKLPGISLSSIHSRFLSRRVCPSLVCQFKGSFHHFSTSIRALSFLGLPAPAALKQELAGELTVNRVGSSARPSTVRTHHARGEFREDILRVPR